MSLEIGLIWINDENVKVKQKKQCNSCTLTLGLNVSCIHKKSKQYSISHHVICSISGVSVTVAVKISILQMYEIFFSMCNFFSSPRKKVWMGKVRTSQIRKSVPNQPNASKNLSFTPWESDHANLSSQMAL